MKFLCWPLKFKIILSYALFKVNLFYVANKHSPDVVRMILDSAAYGDLEDLKRNHIKNYSELRQARNKLAIRWIVKTIYLTAGDYFHHSGDSARSVNTVRAFVFRRAVFHTVPRANLDFVCFDFLFLQHTRRQCQK